MPTNTQDIGCCNICNTKSIGSEKKIKLWLKLHFQQNHPTQERTMVGLQETKFIPTSHRYKNKTDYAEKATFKDNLPILKFG
jgi:hypothetical protein